jgi:hypothetical protein
VHGEAGERDPGGELAQEDGDRSLAGQLLQLLSEPCAARFDLIRAGSIVLWLALDKVGDVDIFALET